MLEIYWGLLITGTLFTLLTVLFDDIIGNLLDVLSVDLPGFLSTTVIMSFLTAFGGAGVVLTLYTELSTSAILALSAMISFVAATLFYLLYIRPMENSENSTGFSIGDFRGTVAEVSVSIPATGYGEVMVKAGAGYTNQIAASFDKEEIPTGEKVIVVEVKDQVLYVSRYEPHWNTPG